MKNIPALIIIVIISIQPAFAQDSLSVKRVDYNFSIYAGPQSINVKELNDALTLYGVDNLGKNALVLGTTHTYFRGKLGFGTGAEYLRIGSSSQMSRYATMNGYTIEAHVAYYLVDRKSVAFYPTLELRSATMYVKTIQTLPSPDISDVLLQSHRNATIRYNNDMLSLAGNFSYRMGRMLGSGLALDRVSQG
ncbi:MAG: hypothetical protein WDO14_00255 [Bacteroidota bacterium]